MTERLEIRLTVDGAPLSCAAGQTVATALLANSRYLLRLSPNAQTPRGAFCMMGACQECAIHIDGGLRRACQTEVRDGMRIELRGAAGGIAARSPDNPT
jgi:predicted molibdopterin-dependent oxidoreductase YjgC